MAQKKIVYDAIIVGSGAAGGIAAHVLVNRGLNVLLLEIGPKWDRNTIFHTEHSWPYEMPFRGLGKPGQYDGLWKVSAYTEHLYVHPRVDRYAPRLAQPRLTRCGRQVLPVRRELLHTVVEAISYI